jgi:hypothetical protein
VENAGDVVHVDVSDHECRLNPLPLGGASHFVGGARDAAAPKNLLSSKPV